MCAKDRSRLNFFTILAGTFIVLAALATPGVAFADQPAPTPDNGTCINCHEDLYYLHDTGKYFCLNESPMSCVDCHGGNPKAITQEEAHTLRTAYPVIDDDISKCQECHPDQCSERMAKFDRVAGFSDILVAGPYLPQLSTEKDTPSTHVTDKPDKSWMFLGMEALVLIIVAGLTVVLYFIHKARKT
jgi:hypothetical protein